MAVKAYFGTDNVFRRACELAEIPVTRRQHKKYTERRGKAWEKRNDAIRDLASKRQAVA